MVVDRKSEQLPILVTPSWRHCETTKEFASGFLRRLAGMRFAHPMQSSRGEQNPVKSRVAEPGSGVRPPEGVENGDGDTGSLRSAARMRIDGAGRGAQTGQRGGFDAAIRGKTGTPDIPEAGLAESELAIGFDAFMALALDHFPPEIERVFGFVEVRFLDNFCEDVEIVNFAQHVLEALEIAAPVGIVLGEQALDRVTESLQREAFCGETPNGHEAGALAERALKSLPGFLVEFGGQAERVLSQIRFV